VGEPPHKRWREVETVKFIIYDFKDRKEEKSEKIEFPVVEAHGYKWFISVYPRGRSESLTDTEYMACHLGFCQKGDVSASYTFSCKGYKIISSMPRQFGKGQKWAFFQISRTTECPRRVSGR
jgi:hypothetical protein